MWDLAANLGFHFSVKLPESTKMFVLVDGFPKTGCRIRVYPRNMYRGSNLQVCQLFTSDYWPCDTLVDHTEAVCAAFQQRVKWQLKIKSSQPDARTDCREEIGGIDRVLLGFVWKIDIARRHDGFQLFGPHGIESGTQWAPSLTVVVWYVST